MVALEASVRSIEKDGLVWGASELVAVGFGIKKLKIILVVEDEKVSTLDLQEEIEGFEDYVQSSDVVSLMTVSELFTETLTFITRLPCRSCKRSSPKGPCHNPTRLTN